MKQLLYKNDDHILFALFFIQLFLFTDIKSVAQASALLSDNLFRLFHFASQKGNQKWYKQRFELVLI